MHWDIVFVGRHNIISRHNVCVLRFNFHGDIKRVWRDNVYMQSLHVWRYNKYGDITCMETLVLYGEIMYVWRHNICMEA